MPRRNPPIPEFDRHRNILENRSDVKRVTGKTEPTHRLPIAKRFRLAGRWFALSKFAGQLEAVQLEFRALADESSPLRAPHAPTHSPPELLVSHVPLLGRPGKGRTVPV